MVEWVRVMTDGAVGGGIGAVDQLVQNQDVKREAEAEPGKPLGVMAQFGTYYNYGVPILAILGTAFGFLRDEWATRLVTAGSQLAGRKITQQFTKAAPPVPWTQKARDPSIEARRRAEVARREAARSAVAQAGGEYSDVNIPIIADESILV